MFVRSVNVSAARCGGHVVVVPWSGRGSCDVGWYVGRGWFLRGHECRRFGSCGGLGRCGGYWYRVVSFQVGDGTAAPFLESVGIG